MAVPFFFLHVDVLIIDPPRSIYSFLIYITLPV